MVSLPLLLALFSIYTYFKNPFITIFAEDTMTPSQRLKVGQTLVSAAGKFELGFFSPTNKKGIRYLGIWYTGISPQTVVWVANTRKPLQSKNASLQLKSNGALALFDNTDRPFYIYMPTKNVSNLGLKIYDSGNLVIVHGVLAPFVLQSPFWQSFDYPSDTLLPAMNLGFSFGRNLVLTSWKKDDDPSPGEFMFGLDKPQLPQLLLKRNSIKVSRWGPWEGVRFSGSDIFDANVFIQPHFKTSYFQFNVPEEYLVRLQVNPHGKIQFLFWNNSISKWNPFINLNKDRCDNYNLCGPFGICHPEKRTCRCLRGFVPTKGQNQHGIALGAGCRRNLELKCDAGDGFTKFGYLKLPDNGVVWPNLSPKQCENSCLQKCSCNAYSYIDVYENGSNCVVWFGELLDMRALPERGDEIHIRMVYNLHPIPGEPIVSNKTDKKKNLIVVTIVSILCVLVFSVLLLICWFKRRSTRRLATWSELSTDAIRVNSPWSRSPVFMGTNSRLNQQRSQQRNGNNSEEENSDFRLFEVDIISEATNNFSNANKIGEGGFGPVYKGVLHNGREIAVKRLASSSSQGQEQFENESSLVARLQHRNLVKLVGCCVHEQERMLIYEYLPNKSLDKFIFDQARKMLLTWAMRVAIILGVAKGLAYLHDDSGLTIVHRDLKASNILLDGEMIPKISDFGLAIILGEDNELNERTIKVYGTFGYLSPEYAMSGQFSTKSDVFSFGVLVLEIISGKKNWGFHHHENDTNLLGHAWNLWIRGNVLEMMDPAIRDLSSETQILRCIQVGLLCVQHNPEQRPTMSTIVAMLTYDSVVLPEPTTPGFFPESSLLTSIDGSAKPPSASFNGLTITTLNAR